MLLVVLIADRRKIFAADEKVQRGFAPTAGQRQRVVEKRRKMIREAVRGEKMGGHPTATAILKKTTRSA